MNRTTRQLIQRRAGSCLPRKQNEPINPIWVGGRQEPALQKANSAAELGKNNVSLRHNGRCPAEVPARKTDQQNVQRKDQAARSGVTTVEFAIVLPLFLLVLFFFFEAWRFMQFQQAVDQAAYEAVRAAIVPGATVEDARAAADPILDSVGAATAVVSIAPETIDSQTKEVSVSISLSHGDVGLFYDWFSSDYEFASAITMAHENARIGRAE